jgi:PTS system ascorbate-specific IIA component
VIGIILIAYGNIGQSLTDAATHILGESAAHIECIAIHDTPGTVDELPDLITEAIKRLDCTQCLILVDLPGSTHFNVTRGFTRQPNIAMLTGLNLPMLLRVLTHQENDLDELLHYGSDGGIQGILSFYQQSHAEEETSVVPGL